MVRHGKYLFFSSFLEIYTKELKTHLFYNTKDSISKCSGCGIEYKAIPKEDESGVGRFNCKCGHVFK